MSVNRIVSQCDVLQAFKDHATLEISLADGVQNGVAVLKGFQRLLDRHLATKDLLVPSAYHEPELSESDQLLPEIVSGLSMQTVQSVSPQCSELSTVA